MKVLVYKDLGATEGAPEALHRWLKEELPSDYKVLYTNAVEIKDYNILKDKSIRAFFMPGGESGFLKMKLAGEGDYKINEFVENGGAYYGFCGGGYYACKQIDFTGAKGTFAVEHKTHYAVFFNGVAKGSIPELTYGNYYDPSFLSCNVVKLRYQNNQEADIYYHGGGSFRGDFNDSSYKILAVYDRLKVGENVAVVKCNVGKGYAILSGVHPEMTYRDIEKRVVPFMEHREKAENIREQLFINQQNNKNFHKFLLKDLLK